MKTCFTCKKEKPLDQFQIQSRSKGGLTPSCKSCVNARVKHLPMSAYEIIIDYDRIEEERWKPIFINGEVFPYHISDFGRVRSGKSELLLKYSFDARHYPQVMLYGNGKRISRRVHILVATAFVVNFDPFNKIRVNHIDGRKSYPYYRNLEWCTNEENMDHAVENNLKFTKRVIKISTGEIFESVKAAADDSGIPHLYQYLKGKLNNEGLDYKYYEEESFDDWNYT